MLTWYQASLVVMVTWRLEHHPAGGDPAEALLELDEVLDDFAADVRVRVHALEIDLYGGFHVYHQCFAGNKKSHRSARLSLISLKSSADIATFPRNVRFLLKADTRWCG